ncbi:MAG: phosphatase PAP2 family protein [Candidatus Delongbacteria bacterium]|nr:phosphatase PAP2 family protein [Candidatus Delongbacteria bacterium]MBN2836212.1 phosphatase PAP2 family protein [Candidatus Delongbacteria bacterium]
MRIVILIIVLYKCLLGSEFEISLTKDILLSGSGVLASGITLFTDPKNKSVGSKSKINNLDEFFMNGFHEIPDIYSTYTAYYLVASPLLFVLDRKYNELKTYGIMYAETLLLTTGVKELLKNSFSRIRPYAYFKNIPDNFDDEYNKSFPSGHTAYSFASAGFITSILISDYEPSFTRNSIIVGSYLLASSVGITRVTSGSHFFTDVISGAILGTTTGYLIPFLHKKNCSLSLIPKYDGIEIVYNL